MKKKKILIGILSVILVVLCAVALFLEKNTLKQKEETELANAGNVQDSYSWEEYQALSLEDQDAYFQRFDSVEAFEKWMEEVKPVEPPVEPTAPKVEQKTDYAASFNKAKAGTYRVKASGGLNLRCGASTDKTILETLADGSKVVCYGYYTEDWLYVKAPSGAVGFCHGDYLEKV